MSDDPSLTCSSFASAAHLQIRAKATQTSSPTTSLWKICNKHARLKHKFINLHLGTSEFRANIKLSFGPHRGNPRPLRWDLRPWSRGPWSRAIIRYKDFNHFEWRSEAILEHIVIQIYTCCNYDAGMIIVGVITILWIYYVTMSYHSLLYSALLCFALLTLLCDAMLYYALLCYAMLYYPMLCYAKKEAMVFAEKGFGLEGGSWNMDSSAT